MLTLIFSLLASGISLKIIRGRLPAKRPSEDRWNTITIAHCGGIVFLPIYLLMIYFELDTIDLKLGLLWLSVSCIWLTGLIDDLHPILPQSRLFIQAGLAVALIAAGWQLEWFANPLINIGLSFFWIVGLTNAFNIIDNMDGLCSGTAIIALIFIMVITNNPLAVILLGIVLGFFFFNFPMASIFMGDVGALFLGMNIACLTMTPELGLWAVPLLIIPIGDTTFVTIRRLLKGKSPARGGLDHSSHVLARRIGVRAALAILYLIGIVGGLSFFW